MYEDYESKTTDKENARIAADRPNAGARAEPWDRSRPEVRERGEVPGGRRAGGWRKGALIYVAVLAGILLIGFAIMKMFSGSDDASYAAPNKPYIAQLNVIGTISASSEGGVFGSEAAYNHGWTLSLLDELIYDNNNQGLILFVDSPGGGVYESDELYLKLREYTDETGCPVYAVMGSMAASGGYYIAAAAERIYANRNTWTGSIGVTMGTMLDVSDFLESHGVKVETIIAGRNKAMGSSFAPMTDEQKSIFQGLIDEAYDQFTGIVAEERALDLEYVRGLADGRIYTAAQALENGLVDDLGDLETAFDDMCKEYGLVSCEWTEFNYTDDSLFGMLFGATAEKGAAAMLSFFSDMLTREGGDVEAMLKLAENRVPAPQYLYGGR
ncbi:MAG: signal peptide peptidase SppA [Clostridiales Family XIII bacterium]|jgi:protease-4|nr:signal peptide peptidase SppA [Clostridiales Family XIII bacterium]